MDLCSKVIIGLLGLMGIVSFAGLVFYIHYRIMGWMYDWYEDAPFPCDRYERHIQWYALLFAITFSMIVVGLMEILL